LRVIIGVRRSIIGKSKGIIGMRSRELKMDSE